MSTSRSSHERNRHSRCGTIAMRCSSSIGILKDVRCVLPRRSQHGFAHASKNYSIEGKTRKLWVYFCQQLCWDQRYRAVKQLSLVGWRENLNRRNGWEASDDDTGRTIARCEAFQKEKELLSIFRPIRAEWAILGNAGQGEFRRSALRRFIGDGRPEEPSSSNATAGGSYANELAQNEIKSPDSKPGGRIHSSNQGTGVCIRLPTTG